jgi:perosamine synthetase
VLGEIDAASGNLDAGRLEAALGPATKAILVSHLHGGLVPMPDVMRIARTRGVPVVEDACQMPGATVCGRAAGTWGDVGVLSFGGSKLLSAGRGGALVTASGDVAQRVRLYVQRGNDAYPLSEMQAAVLVPQLDRLADDNARRAAAVARLIEMLAERGLAGLRPFSNAPSDAGPSSPGYYKLGFWYDAESFGGLPRDAFAKAVRAEGIALDSGFRSLHAIHSARRFRATGDLSMATRADDSVLTLHHPVLLGGAEDIAQVVEAIERVQRSAREIWAMGAGC